MAINKQFVYRVDPSESGLRLDAFIARHLKSMSRSYASWLVQQGYVRVDGLRQKPAYKLKPEQTIEGTVPTKAATPQLKPENKDLDILYEDDAIILLNKPPGIVVHPAAGHHNGTLVNRLLHHCPDLPGIKAEKRPGIVHRLDKDTSGVLVVAKDNFSLQHLAKQFKQRKIRKTYLALVYGVPEDDEGVVSYPIGRHPVDRKKMAIVPNGRAALTHWWKKEIFEGLSLLEIDLKTGRTHQIRVHCKAIGHSIVGDTVYGSKNAASAIRKHHAQTYCLLSSISRQMLHAFRLTLVHPYSEREISVEAKLPEDMKHLLDELRRQHKEKTLPKP